MNATPDWVLTLAFWLHMLGTVLWIGGLTTVYFLLRPASTNNQNYAELLDHIQSRLQGLGWFSAVLLLGTGMFQMSASPNYEGILAITNRWAIAMILKHLSYVGMVAVSAYLTWGLHPSLRRVLLRQSKGLSADGLDRLRRRESALMRLNLFLAGLVLAFTALARVS